MQAAAARRPRVLTEIDPHSEWVHGRELDAIMVDVTGTYVLVDKTTAPAGTASCIHVNMCHRVVVDTSQGSARTS
jgi:hypothetical protein